MDPERRAILIGSSQFPADPKLPPLRCPDNDVEGLRRLLCSDAQGGYYREVVPLPNKPHYEVLKAVNVALRRANKDDFVLIYYSGHGKLDRAGRLYLAASNTEGDALESTSVPVAAILDYVRLSNCRNVGLILDCCYSGAVGDSIFKGGVEEQLQQASSSAGIYILTASTSVQVAEEKEKDEYGLLTKHIIRGIESGEADAREAGQISMDDLYRYVHPKVRQEGFQEPMKWDLGVKGELIVARSGRTPREERRKEIRAMMLKYAEQRLISDRLLSQALHVLALRPDELHGDERKRDDLLQELLHERLPLGEFIDQWNILPLPPLPPDRSGGRRIAIMHKDPDGTTTTVTRGRRRMIALVAVLVPVMALAGWWIMSLAREGSPTESHPPITTVPKAEPQAAGAAKQRAPTVKTNPGDGQTYVWIPPGEFQMGCSPGDSECGGDEKPARKVKITRGFWLGQTEVTQAAYERVTGANPSDVGGAQHPVESVSWTQARNYCEAVGGRLPTEAEWEYAARAGNPASRYGQIDAIAWHNSGMAHQVREKKPNAKGLYDMLGNVWEWVEDWYEEGYYRTLSSPAVDPKGPPKGTLRVLRGGSWLSPPRQVRASVRYSERPEFWSTHVGFRCAREVIP
ncbi:MAG: SUMF1/EgtB/PvdO family nonheme iron enzyme [Bryobacterales bacterium]|nr:SUMF1/EgtB/PvdO family nonheme iron enzyme [Bryobacterales bacterium]